MVRRNQIQLLYKLTAENKDIVLVDNEFQGRILITWDW